MRGTSRGVAGRERIEAAGIDPAEADPDRLGTVLEQIGDVTVVVWLMASAQGSPDEVEAVNVQRLESLMLRLVDTPVRGFVHEARGSAGEEVLGRGAALVEDASRRWRIPVRSLRADPEAYEGWTDEAVAAVNSLLSPS